MANRSLGQRSLPKNVSYVHRLPLQTGVRRIPLSLLGVGWCRSQPVTHHARALALGRGSPASWPRWRELARDGACGRGPVEVHAASPDVSPDERRGHFGMITLPYRADAPRADPMSQRNVPGSAGRQGRLGCRANQQFPIRSNGRAIGHFGPCSPCAPVPFESAVLVLEISVAVACASPGDPLRRLRFVASRADVLLGVRCRTVSQPACFAALAASKSSNDRRA